MPAELWAAKPAPAVPVLTLSTPDYVVSDFIGDQAEVIGDCHARLRALKAIIAPNAKGAAP